MGEILSLSDRARLFQGKRLTSIPLFSCNLFTAARFIHTLAGFRSFHFSAFIFGLYTTLFQGEVQGSRLYQDLLKRAKHQFSETFASENRLVNSFLNFVSLSQRICALEAVLCSKSG